MARAKAANGQIDEAVKIGHNSNLNSDEKLKLSGVISEVERLNEIIADYNSQKVEIYKAAKDQGFDTAAIKHVVKLRKMKPDKRKDFENTLDAYLLAMTDFVTTPLGQAGLPDQPSA